MFCSSCGQALGGVAHVVNNQLLCENCFSKIGQVQATSQQHTVLLSHVNEDERVAASQAIPNENVPEVTPSAKQAASQVGTAGGQMTGQSQVPVSSPFMFAGEQVLWKRTFSKGIIHREATLTEMITNLRVLCIDDQQQAIVRAAPLEDATIAVTNTRRDYSGVHTGFERYGAYTGVSRGSGVTIGNVQVFVQGRIVLTLSNIRDPFGLKRLIDNSVKSSKRGMR